MIIFFISSGVDIGIGHVRRCAQLANELIAKNLEILFCLNHDPRSLEIIDPYNFKTEIISDEDGILGILKQNHDVSVLIYDLLKVKREDNQYIKTHYPHIKILALDYFDMNDPNVDTIINLYNHNITLAQPLSTAVRYLEGPKYGILRDEFKAVLKNKNSGRKVSLRKLLITFGGSDPQMNTLFVLPVINELKFAKELDVTVIIGPNFAHANQVPILVETLSLNIKIISSPTNMASLMNNIDLCICGSGTTILELAALGIPAIVLPQSVEEYHFSKSLESAGFAKVIGRLNSLDRSYLADILNNYYTKPDKLARAGAIGPELCDGLGDQRIVDEVVALLNS